MEPLGESIYDMYPEFGSLGLSEACQIGIEMVKTVKQFHEQDLVHKDIKLDNLMIKNKVPINSSPDSLSKDKNLDNGIVKLIDFSLAESYKDSNGDHVEEKKNVLTKGNVLFLGKRALQQKT